MEIDLTYADIDITHRLNKGHKSPRPIIVRFSNFYSKEQMYRGRWKLRKNSGLKGLGVDPKKVYINENLMPIELAYSRKSAIAEREIGGSEQPTEKIIC